MKIQSLANLTNYCNRLEILNFNDEDSYEN